MVSDRQRLRLHQEIEQCQSLRELKDLARMLLEREIARKQANDTLGHRSDPQRS